MRPLLPSLPVGGARRRAVLVLAGVLALNAADSSTIGAVGPLLQKDLGIGMAQLGLLASASALFGALATIPVGSLTDRVHRTRLLAGSIVVWGVAMVATAVAPDFGWLLLAQLCLGAVTATAGPVVASMVGDMFPSAERGRVWGDAHRRHRVVHGRAACARRGRAEPAAIARRRSAHRSAHARGVHQEPRAAAPRDEQAACL